MSAVKNGHQESLNRIPTQGDRPGQNARAGLILLLPEGNAFLPALIQIMADAYLGAKANTIFFLYYNS